MNLTLACVYVFFILLSLYFVYLVFSFLRHGIAAFKLYLNLHAHEYKSDYERYYERKRDRQE
uniref:Uncharacterized protein n=1 Tax=Dulem virus 171 TaxID=3145648 RepID=A0AAU8AZF4_9VIRU